MQTKTKYYYHEWSSADDALLTEIMSSPERKKVLDRFNEASERLHRTAKSCQNRWYDIRSKQEQAV